MSDSDQEEFKRQLQKLLREYDSNIGMAGLVCGTPVELMPEAEQIRMHNGFCTPENLKVLVISLEKLNVAKSFDLDPSESEKVNAALPKLENLIKLVTSVVNKEMNRKEFRTEVRQLLHKPIPETEDDLITALSALIDTLNFLGEQEIDSKEAWDRMVDCCQMYDALERAQKVCTALQELSKAKTHQQLGSPAIDSTLDIVRANKATLEVFFNKQRGSGELQAHFNKLSSDLIELWGEGS